MYNVSEELKKKNNKKIGIPLRVSDHLHSRILLPCSVSLCFLIILLLFIYFCAWMCIYFNLQKPTWIYQLHTLTTLCMMCSCHGHELYQTTVPQDENNLATNNSTPILLMFQDFFLLNLFAYIFLTSIDF